VEQGFFGVFEVFITSIVICTMTALVFLSYDPEGKGVFEAGEALRMSFESGLPFVGGICLTLSLVFFSLSTILGWSFYGEVCLDYLFKRGKRMCFAYRILFVAVVYFASVGQNDLVWSISELLNGLMAIPNLIGVVFLSEKVIDFTKKNFH